LNFYYSLILEILLNCIIFGLLLYGLVLMWLKKKMMTLFHFWTVFFCTDYDSDFKFFCITFCILYASFRQSTELLLVWSFLYMRFVIRWICMWLSSVLWAVFAFTFFDMLCIQWHCLAKGIYGIYKLWLWLWLWLWLLSGSESRHTSSCICRVGITNCRKWSVRLGCHLVVQHLYHILWKSATDSKVNIRLTFTLLPLILPPHSPKGGIVCLLLPLRKECRLRKFHKFQIIGGKTEHLKKNESITYSNRPSVQTKNEMKYLINKKILTCRNFNE
jgi:hypothetical protein